MEAKRISVITGIYNCADTLPAALDSMLAQTYENWQMILCDDGSSDDTLKVARSYVERYPEKFILLQNEQNLGLNATLNRCLSVADGDYIARMDGDDLSLPNRLEKEVEFLNSHPEYAIVSTPMEYFDDGGVFMAGTGGGSPDVNGFVRGTPFCHAPCMVRKEAYEAVGGYSVDKKLLRVEDWHLWIKMYAAGYRGYVLEEPLYQMRDDRNAAGRRKFKYRLNESRVSRFAVKALGLPPVNYLFSLRPILVGLLPGPVYRVLHRRKLRGCGLSGEEV